MTRQPWTDERTEEVGRLDGQGLSESQIAKVMGCSKNAVHWQRIKLELVKPREPKAEAPHRSLSEKLRVGSFKLSKPGTRPPGGTPAPRHIVLDEPSRIDGKTIEQTTRGCRWPIGGEGAETLFCCRAKVRGSYCDDHAKRAFTTSQVPAKEMPKLVRMFRRAA